MPVLTMVSMHNTGRLFPVKIPAINMICCDWVLFFKLKTERDFEELNHHEYKKIY